VKAGAMKDTIKKALYIFLLAFVIILADQLTKHIIENKVINYGAAFGLFQNATMLFVWAAVIIIGLVLFLYDKIPKKRTDIQIYTGMILGGAVSNLIDRLAFGYVIDYIDLKVWPAFNIADAAVTIGMIGVIIYLLKKKK
jgi:signal peptidase II